MSEQLERPQLAILRYITPAAFAPHHLQQFYRLEKFEGLQAASLAYRVATQELFLWEVGDDENHAVVLTSIVEDGARRMLWIEGAAGNGILANAKDIVDDLCKIAGFYACDRLRASSARDGFESLPDKLGFKPVSTIWEVEVEDGGRKQAAGDADGHSEE